MKALVGAFNQEKALVGAFSVIVQLHRLIDLRHYSLHVPSRGTLTLNSSGATREWRAAGNSVSNLLERPNLKRRDDQSSAELHIAISDIWSLELGVT